MKSRINKRSNGLLIIALAVVSPVALAHGDMDKPLYVAVNGADRDRCFDPAAPCRTLAYALRRVGKGGQIRVGPGRFEISDTDSLFHLVSGIVDIRGGFDHGFRQPGVETTILVGVPPDFRSVLGSKGFHVVADHKATDEATAAETLALLELHQSMQQPLKAEPCTGGSSSGLDCQNAELLAHVPFGDVSARPGAAADVWGFLDLNTNREYVLVGYNIGTAVFDVSDPARPREVGFIDGRNTTWRDIKVYQRLEPSGERWHAYAYVTTDGSSDGLFVIDLGGLPQSVARIGYASDFSAAHNVFAAHTEYGTGLSLTGAVPSLIVAGSNNGGGRYRAYSLEDPAAPRFVAMPNVAANDYMHDAASIIIRDARKDTQCVNAADYCELLFDFNETTVDVWDVTIGDLPVRLSRTPYANASYTHSGWPSEDGRYLFVHDELDEQGLGLQTTVRVFDLANLAAPVLVGQWTGPSQAIDHNGFVRGSRYYMSTYSRGLTVLDISDPTQPVTAGMLDTYPFSDSASFVGAWGVYPFLPSGTLALSDISSGLYLIGDRTLDSAAGSLSFSRASYGAAEGGQGILTVARNDGASGAVSVTLEAVPVSADSSDGALSAVTLQWGDGDSVPRTVSYQASADGENEGLEQLFVRLLAPTGGATLAPSSNASVWVSDPGAGAEVGFASDETLVAERGFNTAVVVLQRRGNAAGAVSVDYAITGGDAVGGADYEGTAAGRVQWDDGDALPKWIEFAILDDGAVEEQEFIELALGAVSGAAIGTGATTRITILDGTGSNAAPNAVAGPSISVAPGATVTLDGAASNDPDGDSLTYAWQQSLGPDVTLTGADTVAPGFTAPAVNSDTLLSFELTVTDPRGLSDTAGTNVTVTSSSSTGGKGGGGMGPGWLALLALWIVRRRANPGRKDAV